MYCDRQWIRSWSRSLAVIWPILITGLCAIAENAEALNSEEEIMLLVRSDDMGAAHAVNEACLTTVTDGIARSIEVIVPAPWFLEAAEMLKMHPHIDVGVHLDLTSEWSCVKWGPVSKNVPSLVDANGHFFPMTRQRPDWPPNTGFLDSDWKIGEVERELRAQIEMALRHLPKVTHLSAHMGTATSTPQLHRLVEHLGAEYGLATRLPNVGRAGRFGDKDDLPAEREAAMIRLIDRLKPGFWMLVEHPGLDTPEMRSIRHDGYENVAADRAAVTQVFTSKKVQRAIARRKIRLVSYADVLEMNSQPSDVK
jgi:predicted glycoside hydrolase/deacetylase ChbG (UPF0249 family)